MKSKNEILSIVLLLIVMILSVASLTYMVVTKGSLILIVLLGLLFVVSVYRLFYVYNARNRKLSIFFDAIRNEDSSLVFPEKVGSPSLRHLHVSLNKLNRLIADIKLRNERNELFYCELIEQSATGLLSFDELGYIDVMNSAAKRYLGVIQLSNLKLLEQMNPELHQILTQLKTGEKTVVKNMVGNELVSLSVQGSDMQFGNQRHRLISLQDIRYELEESEIDSWQKLIRVMTHEIMNSIAPITSLSHTLLHFFQKQGKTIDPIQLNSSIIADTIEGLNIIEERGKGLIHFVDNYRKLAKVPQPIFSTLNVKTWVQGMTLLFKPTMEQHGIRFSTSLSKGIDLIQTDEKLLDQLMINLMTNAIEAVCSNPERDVPSIGLSVRKSSANTLLLELSDNGPGIDESLMDKIFVPFFTTKEGGNGIGLSLSRQLASKLNMKLSVRSKPSQGSTFQLEL